MVSVYNAVLYQSFMELNGIFVKGQNYVIKSSQEQYTVHFD